MINSLFKRLEKTFATDISYLIKSGGWLGTSQIFIFASSIFLAYAFANFISPEKYGTYKYFLTLISFFSIFTLSGIGTAVVRTVGRGAESNVFLGLRTKIKWGLIGAGASLIASLYYLQQGNFEFFFILLIISLFIPFKDSMSLYQGYLAGKKLFKVVSRNTIQVQFLTTISMLLALLYTDRIWILVAIFLAVPTIFNGIKFYFNLKKYPPQDTIKDDDLSDGMHISFMSGIGVATGSLHGIALWHFLGPAGLAVYALAIAPIEQVRPFLRLAETLFLPKIAQDSWELPNFRTFCKKLLPFVMVVSSGVLLYILVAPLIYKLLFPLYLESVVYSQILSVSLMITAITIVTSTILKAKKMMGGLYTLSVVNIFSDILYIPAIYFWDLYGIVFAILFQKILLMVISFLIIFNRKVKIIQYINSVSVKKINN